MMTLIHHDNATPRALTHADIFHHMVASVTNKLDAAIAAFRFGSYAEARAYVKPQTTAGAKVWDVIDAQYATRAF